MTNVMTFPKEPEGDVTQDMASTVENHEEPGPGSSRWQYRY